MHRSRLALVTLAWGLVLGCLVQAPPPSAAADIRDQYVNYDDLPAIVTDRSTPGCRDNRVYVPQFPKDCFRTVDFAYSLDVPGTVQEGETVTVTSTVFGAPTIDIIDEGSTLAGEYGWIEVCDPGCAAFGATPGRLEARPRMKLVAPYCVISGTSTSCSVQFFRGGLPDGAWFRVRQMVGGAACTQYEPGTTASVRKCLSRNVRSGLTLGYVSAPVYITGAAGESPTARFTATEQADERGTFQFVSNSTDPQGQALSQEWDFGDGETAQGPAATHTYAKPGRYDVRLVVTDTDGNVATKVDPVTVAAPDLQLAVSFPGRDSAAFGLDEEFTVRVSASAGDGLGDLTDVVVDPQLEWSPEAGVQLLSGPDPVPPDPLTLSPGADPTIFEYRFKAVAPGKVTFRAAASAEDASGRSVGPVEVERHAEVSVLKVTIAFDPATIDLVEQQDPEDADGDGLADAPGLEPQRVTGTITIENTGDETVDNLSLSGTQDHLDLRTLTRVGGVPVPVESPVPFPLAVTVAPHPKAPSGELGTLGAGDSTVQEFEVEASGRALFGVATTVLGTTASGASTGAHGEGLLDARSDVKLRVQMKVGTVYGRPPRIDEGHAYLVFGTLKNVTTDETIAVDALLPLTEGNGIALGPVPSPEVPAEDVCANILMAPTLEPGESVEFTLRVVTKDIVAPLSTVRQVSTVRMDVGGTATNADGTTIDLTDANVKIELGNGRDVTDAGERLRVVLEPNLPTPRLLEPDDPQTYKAFIDAFTEAFMLGVADWGVQTIHLLGGISKLGGAALTALFNGDAKDRLDKQLTETAWFLGHVWSAMNPVERDEVKQQAYHDVLESMGKAIVDTEEALRVVDSAIEGYFDGIQGWLDRADSEKQQGDMQELLRMMAEPVRVATTAIVDEIAGEALVKGLCRIFAKDPKWVGPAQREAAAIEGQAATKVDTALTADRAVGDPRVTEMKELKKLDPWTPISPAQANGGWVVDPVSDSNLRAYTKQTPVMVAVRSRAKETAAWLESALGATLKPEAYKPKMANGLDGRYLGYRTGTPGYGGGDLGSAVLAEPLPWEVVAQRIDGLSGEEWRLAKRRWETRYKEWHGHLPGETPKPGKLSKVQELKAAAPDPIVDPAGVEGFEGTLQLPRKGTVNYGGNLDTVGKAVEMEPRRFQLRKVAAPPDSGLFGDAGREYYEVWLEDADGVLKRVTGDIDTVGVWGNDGRWLDNARAIQVVEDLTEVSGAQHPWTSTWSDPEGRAELLAAHLWSDNPANRGEPMLLYVNGEARLAWFDPRKNYDVDDGPAFIFLEGAPHTFDPIDLPTTIDGPAGLPDPDDLVQRGYVAPKVSLKQSPDLGGPTAPRCDVVTADDSDARILRLGGDGHIEEWTPAGGWQDVDPATLCKGGRPLKVRPQTGVETSTAAGDTELPIIQLVDAPANNGFRIGQTVVIDAGGPNEETALVAGFGSLIFAAPLTKAHEPGEVVSAVYSAPDLPATGSSSTTLLGALGALCLVMGLALLSAGRVRREGWR